MLLAFQSYFLIHKTIQTWYVLFFNINRTEHQTPRSRLQYIRLMSDLLCTNASYIFFISFQGVWKSLPSYFLLRENNFMKKQATLFGLKKYFFSLMTLFHGEGDTNFQVFSILKKMRISYEVLLLLMIILLIVSAWKMFFIDHLSI